MNRTYKLACNYNVVEITPDIMDLAEMLEDYENLDIVSNEELLKRLLQREYDILSSIQVTSAVTPMAKPKPAPKPEPKSAPTERPSPAQIEWAENLGMEDAKYRSKKEVWEFINKYK